VNTFLWVILHLMRILGPAMVIGYFLYKPLSHLWVLVCGIVIGSIGHFMLDMINSRLCMAARRGNIPEMKELLSGGFYKINAKRSNGMTPLHWTANKGHLDATAFLLEEGADPNVRDNLGSTPLKHAQQEGHQGIADFLRAHGATES
jgi:hypothetical protein